MKVVPPNFGYVEEGIFRCGLPDPRHYAFLTSLGVKTCILLTEAQDNAFVRWLQESGITILCPLEPNRVNSFVEYDTSQQVHHDSGTNYHNKNNNNLMNSSTFAYNSNNERSQQPMPHDMVIQQNSEIANRTAQENNALSAKLNQTNTLTTMQSNSPQSANNTSENSSTQIFAPHSPQATTISKQEQLLQQQEQHEQEQESNAMHTSQLLLNSTNEINNNMYKENYTNTNSSYREEQSANIGNTPATADSVIANNNRGNNKNYTNNAIGGNDGSNSSNNNNNEVNTYAHLPGSHAAQFVRDNIANQRGKSINNSFPDYNQHWLTMSSPSTFASPSSLSGMPNEQLPLSTVRMMLMGAASVVGGGSTYSNILPNALHVAVPYGVQNNINSINNNSNNNMHVLNSRNYNVNTIHASGNRQNKPDNMMYRNNVLHNEQVEYEVGTQGQMTLSEPVVVSILRVLIDPIHYPLLITGAKGRYRTGIVCGCLRKLQRWNLVSILSEYRRYAGDKSRADNEEFIELFDKDLVSLELENGRKPTILYSL